MSQYSTVLENFEWKFPIQFAWYVILQRLLSRHIAQGKTPCVDRDRHKKSCILTPRSYRERKSLPTRYTNTDKISVARPSSFSFTFLLFFAKVLHSLHRSNYCYFFQSCVVVDTVLLGASVIYSLPSWKYICLLSWRLIHLCC